MMRKVVLVLIFLTCNLVLQAQNLTDLYFVYQPDCGGCHKVQEHVLPSDSAGRYIEQNFKLIMVDATQESSYGILQQYQVTKTPTLIFMDQQGSIVEKVVKANYTSKEFIEHGKQIKEIIGYRTLYVNGKISVEQIARYLDVLDLSGLFTTSYYQMAQSYFNTMTEKELNTPSNRALIYHMAAKHPLLLDFNGEAYKFLYTKRALFYKTFNKDQVDARICWVASLTADAAVAAKDSNLFNKALAVLEPFKDKNNFEMNDRKGEKFVSFGWPDWEMKKLTYYIANDSVTFKKRETAMLATAMGNTPAMIAMVNRYLNHFAGFTDEASLNHLRKTKAWINEAIAFGNSYEANYTKALLLTKLKEYNEALAVAKYAATLAAGNEKNQQQANNLVKNINSIVESKK